MLRNKKPELLMPASSLEVLKTAFNYGADACYIGGEMYGLRAKAKNFSLADMKEGIEYAHNLGKKVYVTANITAHNRDLKGIEEYFKELKEIRPDAFIISDPGVFEIAARVVTARELSMEEIKEIRANIPDELEIETFIHGAMCISYSGRCLLSNYFTGRDANMGACTHPCRWKYYVMEESRPGEYLPVFENERGTYIFNSKDLCMIEHIPDIIDAGIDSLKIEGRMKTALYVASVARTYRQAIDDYFEDEEKYRNNIEHYKEEISKCTYRQFTTGFFYGPTSHETQIYDSNTYVKEYTYLGIVQEINQEGECMLYQRNKFSIGDEVEVMKTNGDNLITRVESIKDENGEKMESCPHPKQKIYVKFDKDVRVNELIRMKEI